jgi:hypothetical protein
MSNDSVQLLKQLGFAGRSSPLKSTGACSDCGSIESASFAELLDQVKSGKLGSQRTVEPAADENIQLSNDEQIRLSAAADKAEASGIRSALVLLEGKRLVLDVGSRQVRHAEESSQGITSGVDGVIDLTSKGSSNVVNTIFGPVGAAERPGESANKRNQALGPPGAGVASPSLAAFLSNLPGRNRDG